MKIKLTNYDVLAEIIHAKAGSGYSPSYRELGARLGLSVAGVQHHIEALDLEGLIERIAGQARTITITDEGRRVLRDRARGDRALKRALNARGA